MDAGPRYKNPALAVKTALAQEAIRVLHRVGLLDGTRRTRQLGDEVLIPVLDLARAQAAFPARAAEDDAPTPRTSRDTPYEQVVDRLAGRLPPGMVARVPDRWEKLGRVVVIRLDDELLPHARDVAQAFADVLDVDTVLRDVEGVGGELREMQATTLLGEDPVTTHVENGVRYRFDASRIMFSSGNVHERKRAAAIPARGETVVDMFAGVGYFTLPLAVHARPARIHAIEKNPLSFRFLQENARLNEVEDVVMPWLGDNREFPHEGVADRVLMGYFPGTQKFLPKAMRLLKREGGILHYHNTAHADAWVDELTRQLFDAAMDAHRGAQVVEARVVKSHSPGVVHGVLLANVGPAHGTSAPHPDESQ